MLVIDTSFPAKDFNERNGEPVRQLILHYTAAPFGASLRALTQDGVSAHYLVPDPDEPSYRAAGYDELRAFRLVDEGKRAWHAGVSHWGAQDNLNSRAIGIELVNLARDDAGVFTFPTYPEEQVEVLIALARDILARHPQIGPSEVLGHSDVAYWRKSDPGPRLPWQRLHEAGVGAWFDDAPVRCISAGFALVCRRRLRSSGRFSVMGTSLRRIGERLNSARERSRCTFGRGIIAVFSMRRPARSCMP